MATADVHRDPEPDGKVYVDAVLTAGLRSRGIIGIILILMVVTYASIRNNQEPGWSHERVRFYEELSKCLKVNDLSHGDCSALKDRIATIKNDEPNKDDVVKFAEAADVDLEGEFGSDNFRQLNAIKIHEVELRYAAYLNKDVGIQAITVPIFGTQIDYNDIWIVSGVVMAFLLFLLRSSLEQEFRNIEFIARHMRGYLNVVLLNQVISLPHVARWRILGKLPLILWLTPTFLYMRLLYLDYHTVDSSYIFIGRTETLIEYGCETAAVIIMAIINVMVILSQLRVQNLLDRSAKEMAVTNQAG